MGSAPGSAALMVFTGMSGVMNIRALVAHVGNNSYICRDTAFFSNVRSQDITVADTVNALGPGHAVFLVTHDRGFDQPVQPPWLYQQPPPVLYNARSGSSDPATWTLLDPDQQSAVGPTYAGFWPPHLGIDQTAITYLMFNDDESVLLPRLLADYPGGVRQGIGLDSCPTTYSLTSYTLSARQLAAGQPKTPCRLFPLPLLLNSYRAHRRNVVKRRSGGKKGTLGRHTAQSVNRRRAAGRVRMDHWRSGEGVGPGGVGGAGGRIGTRVGAVERGGVGRY